VPGESRFARKLGDIAVAKSGNGGPDVQDVLEAMRALNDDTLDREDARSAQFATHVEEDRDALALIASHLESEAGRVSEAVTSAIGRHCDAVDTPMMVRISSLEAEHRDIKAVVDDRGARINEAKREVIEEILKEQTRRRDDPDDADHTSERNIVVAERRFTKEQIVTAVILFLVAVLASNLIGALVERVTK